MDGFFFSQHKTEAEHANTSPSPLIFPAVNAGFKPDSTITCVGSAGSQLCPINYCGYGFKEAWSLQAYDWVPLRSNGFPLLVSLQLCTTVCG